MKKIEMPKGWCKTKQEKRAQRFIKNSVADSLTKITVLSAFFATMM